MPGALDRNALDARERQRVDDVHDTLALADRDVHALAVVADRNVIRVARQRDSAHDAQRPRVDDIERAIRLVADVELAAVRRRGGAVADFDAHDVAHDLIRRRIDDVHVVARAVRLHDARVQRRSARRRARQRRAVDPGEERLPFGIALRRPVLATVVMWIAAGFFSERMAQQPAQVRATRHDARTDDVEVRVCLGVGPRGRALRQRRELHRRAIAVTGDATRVAGPLRREDRLDTRFEEFEVERWGRRGCGAVGSGLRDDGRRGQQQGTKE